MQYYGWSGNTLFRPLHTFGRRRIVRERNIYYGGRGYRHPPLKKNMHKYGKVSIGLRRFTMGKRIRRERKKGDNVCMTANTNTISRKRNAEENREQKQPSFLRISLSLWISVLSFSQFQSSADSRKKHSETFFSSVRRSDDHAFVDLGGGRRMNESSPSSVHIQAGRHVRTGNHQPRVPVVDTAYMETQ